MELEKLLPLSSTSLENYNTQYLQKYPGDASVILAASKAQWAISGQKDKEGVANLIAQVARKENDPSLEVSGRSTFTDFQNDWLRYARL